MAHPTSTGVYTRDSTTFPPTETFSGWNHPTRYEADIISLEIEGKLPQGLYGAFFRVQPDCQFPPMFEDDVPINGDGNVAHFIFKDGHVDFKNRYVKTPKFVVERKARKALIGRYRNRVSRGLLLKGRKAHQSL
jgi:carotenoid cleavage dioxygenase